jgi:hypothetical protein
MKPLLNLVIKPRVALAALVSAVTAVVVAALTAGPALARAVSAVAVPGQGFQSQAAGSGHTSLAGLVVIAALVAATVAFGVIGWRYDRRRIARGRIAGDERGTGDVAKVVQPAGEPLTSSGWPAAAKPLPTRGAVASRSRREEGEQAAVAGDRDHGPMI